MRVCVRTTRAVLAAAVVAAVLAPAASAKVNPAPGLRSEARLFSQIVQPGDPGGVGPGAQNRRECVTAGEPGSVPGVDKDISCDSPFAPDNELAVAVHPTRPDLVLAGSNDYQIQFVGATSIVQVPSGYFLSQDGGATWIDGQLPLKGSLGGGDPVPEFNTRYNLAVFTSLSFVCGQFAPLCSRGNIMFASYDLSKLTGSAATTTVTWSDQVIANGNSSDAAAQQIFLDKEWIAVDNNPSSPHYGNMYVTFSAFRLEKGRYDESPIMLTKSEDGGRRWTLPVEISGRNPAYCTYQDDADDTADTSGPTSSQGTAEGPDDPFACDQDQFSVPAVAPNGDLYIHFHNEQNLAAYELPQRYDSQVMIVKSTDGGDTFFGEQPSAANQAGCVRQQQAARGTPTASFANPCIVPIHVVNMEDSYDEAQAEGPDPVFPDYPLNADGRTTLTGHQFRVNSAGNIAIGRNAASPLGYRLWIVYADNFAGVRPLAGAPGIAPITNTNVYYAYSDDGGATWVGGDTGGVSGPGRMTVHPPDAEIDQWFPWAATDPNTGMLRVGYMDARRDGPVRRLYDYSLASIPLGAPPGFFDPAPTFLSGAPSDPNNSLFFRRPCVPGGPPQCSAFIGDYNGLAVDANSRVHGVWTDMRRGFPNAATDPKTEDAYYARRPPTP